mmetsp:Transcript_16651/g.47480  ORF Transcript_16651/g.47480 Transcript_16651/m.47480 type:complete len:246 (-) Transcript_16651:765-1502(-)
MHYGDVERSSSLCVSSRRWSPTGRWLGTVVVKVVLDGSVHWLSLRERGADIVHGRVPSDARDRLEVLHRLVQHLPRHRRGRLPRGPAHGEQHGLPHHLVLGVPHGHSAAVDEPSSPSENAAAGIDVEAVLLPDGQGLAQKDHRGVKEEVGPLRVVVAVEEHEVLVAGVGRVQLLRVVRLDEGVALAMREERRDEALAAVLDGAHVLWIELGALADRAPDHARGHRDREAWHPEAVLSGVVGQLVG